MINARQAFLENGHYMPLAGELTHFVTSHLRAKDELDMLRLLDLGCGEGYYLNQISENLNEENINYCGIDISKAAVQKAAKRKLIANFAVASTYNIPCLDNEVDVVMQVFAPCNTNEVSRVVKPCGHWLHVQPGPEHLFEMKQLVYDSPAMHVQEVPETIEFEVIDQKSLKYTFNLLGKADRLALLEMTPFYWSISEVKKQILLEKLTSATANFVITRLKKAS